MASHHGMHATHLPFLSLLLLLALLREAVQLLRRELEIEEQSAAAKAQTDQQRVATQQQKLALEEEKAQMRDALERLKIQKDLSIAQERINSAERSQRRHSRLHRQRNSFGTAIPNNSGDQCSELQFRTFFAMFGIAIPNMFLQCSELQFRTSEHDVRN